MPLPEHFTVAAAIPKCQNAISSVGIWWAQRAAFIVSEYRVFIDPDGVHKLRHLPPREKHRSLFREVADEYERMCLESGMSGETGYIRSNAEEMHTLILSGVGFTSETELPVRELDPLWIPYHETPKAT
eukprot:889948-Amphidinium_carterae.1